jgi:hypothetical protein
LLDRDFAFRCWKGDENSDEAEVLSGYQGRKGVKSYDGAFSWWPFEVGIEKVAQGGRITTLILGKGLAKLCNETGRKGRVTPLVLAMERGPP